jgi:glycosyltransferase involved in cell wall biosynthesis
MRKVLIVAYDFPPRGGTGVLRVTKFARYLPAFGWQPVVITASAQGWIDDQGLLAELPPNLEVLRVPEPLMRTYGRSASGSKAHLSHPVRSCLRQQVRQFLIPDPRIVWVPVAVRAASARLRCGDIAAVMTTSPPHAVQLAGLWLKRRFPALPWVMDLRDIWSDSPTVRDPLSYKINRLFEGACLRHADRVIAVTEPMRSLLQRTYDIPITRLTTITNGFDPADLPAIEPPPKRDILQVTYVGTMVGTRAPAARGFFEALERLASSGLSADTLKIRLVGEFDEQIHAWAEPFVAQGMVTLLPFLSHAEAIAEMVAADVLLLVMTDDWESRIAVPNKLYEYFAVGRPVLALAPEGEITRLVRAVGGGLVVAPFAVDQIVAALERLIKQHTRDQLPRLLPSDPQLRRFQRRELTRQLATLLDELVA